jgi:hypothetical protein
MATVFVSPGVYTREEDFSVFASQIGITRLGLVGETTKGPAFEPIKISSTDEYAARFGTTDTKLQLPYVANSFLKQSSELTISRILGMEGFTNSPAWIIQASTQKLYSGSSATQTGVTLSITNVITPTGWTISSSANTVMANNTISASTVGNVSVVNFSGNSISTATWANSLNGTSFSGFGITIAGTSSSTYISTAGTATFTLSANTLQSSGAFSGAPLCILRSKSSNEGDPSGPAFYASLENAIKISNITGTLLPFTISGTTGPLTALTQSAITVSLDETRDDYIVKVLGTNPESYSTDFGIYVESIYSHFVREASQRGDIIAIEKNITYSTEDAYTNYLTQYQTPVTPYVVSKVAGGIVKDLFMFTSISDGNSANQEIKISIANIDDVTKTFDVIVRAYGDTDSSIVTLERFRALTLDPSQPNYIAKAIGTADEEYPMVSNYIELTLAINHPTDTVPAGFRGYTFRNTGISGSTAPDIYYKTQYFSGDSTFKTYLGISELGYTGYTSGQVSISKSIQTLEDDLWNYFGANPTGTSTSKGFHMESAASTTDFVVGNQIAISGYTKAERKFTLVPAGGFDGWNQFRDPDFTSSAIDVNNVIAIKAGIDTIQNPEEIDINLFALPGVDYYNHEDVVKYGLSTIEARADALYIIDSPRISDSEGKGTAVEVVSDLQDTGIDSNYAATYWPWIQISDTNYNKFVYVAPTMEVVRAIALTDNVSYPWFAPAGYNRGVVSNLVQKADIKLNQTDRDTLYQDRINPIATFVQQGVVIFGQKTLQVKQSALDRVNVRRLLLQVRRLIAAASQTLLFEENDATVRDQFLQKVEPILLQIQNQRGLTAFNVVLDAPPTGNADPNTMNGKIQLQPTPALEMISLDFQVLPQGANFSDF